VVCLSCGKVEEFYGEPLQRLRRQVENSLGYEVAIARTEIGGYCPNCQVLRKREMEEASGRILGDHKQPDDTEKP
jgi:Fur family ferric uptake transcriptional regulator